MAGTIECILKTKKVKYHKIRIGSATPSPIYIPPNTITKKILQQKQHYVVMNIKYITETSAILYLFLSKKLRFTNFSPTFVLKPLPTSPRKDGQ